MQLKLTATLYLVDNLPEKTDDNERRCQRWFVFTCILGNNVVAKPFPRLDAFLFYSLVFFATVTDNNKVSLIT